MNRRSSTSCARNGASHNVYSLDANSRTGVVSSGVDQASKLVSDVTVVPGELGGAPTGDVPGTREHRDWHKASSPNAELPLSARKAARDEPLPHGTKSASGEDLGLSLTPLLCPKKGTPQPPASRTSPGKAFIRLPASERRRVASDLLNAYLDMRKALDSWRGEPKTIQQMIAEADVREQIQASIDLWRHQLHKAQWDAHS